MISHRLPNPDAPQSRRAFPNPPPRHSGLHPDTCPRPTSRGVWRRTRRPDACSPVPPGGDTAHGEHPIRLTALLHLLHTRRSDCTWIVDGTSAAIASGDPASPMAESVQLDAPKLEAPKTPISLMQLRLPPTRSPSTTAANPARSAGGVPSRFTTASGIPVLASSLMPYSFTRKLVHKSFTRLYYNDLMNNCSSINDDAKEKLQLFSHLTREGSYQSHCMENVASDKFMKK
nr:unnamed protein product [Digitaria exilis]